MSIRRTSLNLLAISAFAVSLAGCSLTATEAPSATILPAINGVVHGGQSPIQAAHVVLYVTSATATTYGAAATVIGTSTSDVNGNFAISPSATSTNCPSGQQAYITAAGGYQSGQSTMVNSQMLLIAALGDCANVSSSTFVTLNEITTVAAAYALSGFMTTSLDSANSVYKANISAPVANNSPITAITPTAPAGLAHAFLNAATLATPSTGSANSTVNVSYSGSTTTGGVPSAEINTLADIMQACVNTQSSTTTPSSNCTMLFGFTPSISGVAPANTLQAFINLARNPYPSAAAMSSSTGLLSLVSSTAAAFVPFLTAAPNDWTLAITYRAGLPAPYFVALDANDTAYLGLTTTSSTTPAIFAINAYGVSVPTFAAQSSGSTARGIAPDTLGNVWVANNASAVDRFSTSTGALLSTYTSAYGSTWPVAVDKQNNLWVGHVLSGSAQNVDEAAYTAPVPPSTTPTWTVNYTASPGTNTGSYGLTIDANQNVWSAGYYSGGDTAILFPNLSTATAPSYTTSGTAITAVTATLNPSTTTTNKPYSYVVDASGNAWEAIYSAGTAATSGLEEVVPNALIGATSITPGTLIASTTAGTNGNTLGTAAPLEMAIDGAGTIFIPDNSTSGVHMYSTTTANTLTPAVGLKGAPTTVSSCSYVAGAGYASTPTVSFSGGGGIGAAATVTVASGKITACTITNGGSGYTTAPTMTLNGGSPTTAGSVTATVMPAVYNPRQIAIDSTGSIWMGFTVGGATQIIGVAAPSYPLLSVGKPGLSPGLTAVNPLP